VTDKFDLVVAAAELPGVNGFRVCNRIKKDPKAKDVPVLLLTSAPSAELEAHRVLPTHADVYMLKPIAMADLLAEGRARASAGAHARVPGAGAAKGPPPLPATETQRRRAATMTGV